MCLSMMDFKEEGMLCKRRSTHYFALFPQLMYTMPSIGLEVHYLCTSCVVKFEQVQESPISEESG